MKTVALTLSLVVLIGFLGLSQPKIYINYVSHNEDSYQYLTNQNLYMNARSGIRDFANDCQTKGAKWSIGSDYVLLKAIAKYDTGSVIINTNNKNLLLWLQEDRNVECDPHSHTSLYNYTDVAYLHTVLGVIPSSVRSGYIYNTISGNGDLWMDYQNSVAGDSFPSYTWQPEILWGAATPGHVNDPEYYGMWKPTDTTDFFVHNSSNHLINYGGGCKIIASDYTVEEMLQIIDNLINKIDSNIAPQSGFYCMSIFFEESNLRTPPFILKLKELSDSINVRVSDGRMQWEHIEDIVQIWKNDYSSQPFYASCDFQDIYTNIQDTRVVNRIKIYPNPTHNVLNITSENYNINNIQILNITGKTIITPSLRDSDSYRKTWQSVDISNLPNGMYFIKINNTEIIKFIKQ